MTTSPQAKQNQNHSFMNLPTNSKVRILLKDKKPIEETKTHRTGHREKINLASAFVRERKVEAQNQKVHILARERCHKCGVSEKKISKEKERERE